jgi:integrase|tara:strand:- start:221 stop:1315 length:1095 start_codon:yes stop_codon:yes gene_type:complete
MPPGQEVPFMLGTANGDGRVRLGELFDRFLSAGAPDKHDHPLPEDKFKLYKRQVDNLREVFDRVAFRDLRVSHCKDYHRHRTAQVREGARGGKGGHRTVDKELNALSVCLNWCATEGLIPWNPLVKKPRFVREIDITHCTEYMPRSAEKLHLAAIAAFGASRSEVLGWQMLIEALTGCRTIEIRELPRDADEGQPGYFDAKRLYIRRSKKGRYPFVIMTPHLFELLTLCREWGRVRFPRSKYLLPGRDGIAPVGGTSLVHWFKAYALKSKGPRYTSHGMRAFFVRATRSQGIGDSVDNAQSVDEEIAKRLGHAPGTGAALVQRTYGESEPDFVGKKEVDFVPKSDAPAWDVMRNQIRKGKCCDE